MIHSNTTGLNSGDGMHRDIHWWLQGIAGDGNIDDDVQGTLGNLDYRHSGIAFGADMALNDQWTIGLAGSFVDSDINGDNSDAEVESYQLAVYANWQQNNWYVDSAVGVAKHNTDSDRTVTIGTLTGTASSDYDSDSIGASIEVGKHFTLDNQLTITPFAGIEYAKADREDFTETGSFAILTVQDEEHESVRTKLGF